MIRYEMAQGSPEWIVARVGKPTSSQFHRILTPGGNLSSQADDYIAELTAEHLLGTSLDDGFTTTFMERGKEIEPQAVKWYQFQNDCDVDRVGFVTNDAGSVGCSPDGLVGEDGAIEIKCPNAKNHVRNILGMSQKYSVQVQGVLWIAEREWLDLVSFHPEIKPVVARVERDPAMIDALSCAMQQFEERLEKAKLLCERLGYIPERVYA